MTLYFPPVRTFAVISLTIVFLVFSPTGLTAQSSPETNNPADAQSRIARARALIAAHQLETAASELESVRGSTQDASVRNITSVMLMSIYLESGNYGRAEALLEEGFSARATQNGDSMRNYYALAGQAVNGARSHIARYRTFGINTTDSDLPAEAVSDLDRLRSFLERIVSQAKQISNERKASDSLSLLEDVLGIRLSLSRDMEDQVKWQTEYINAREVLASQSQVGRVSALPPTKASLGNATATSPYSTRRTTESDSTTTPNSVPSPTAPVENASIAGGTTNAVPAGEPQVTEEGSLNARATRKVVPPYPSLAKQTGATGLVRVFVIVDESGKVVTVSRSEGHVLLRRVAEDAARQWAFIPPVSEGKSVRWSGYIDFNFTL